MDSGIPRFVDTVGAVSGSVSDALAPVIQVAIALVVIVPVVVYAAYHYGPRVARFSVRATTPAFSWVAARSVALVRAVHVPQFKLRAH